ncbi:MAG: hypothetical protein IPM79_25050 [Polyangiaceae bacterium]|jgi:hypothetical protein|nr:hypothetical protein [Polyangiaceae bacterium]MBK8940794.1 hypothetical protein [Polyangiaceae bacterium]
MTFDARRTQVAQSAHDFSVYFAQAFGGVRVRGAVTRRPDLSAPEGMSTGAGRRARQAITLRDDSGATPALTVGWLDIPQRKAALRTHRCLSSMHYARFGDRPFDVDTGSYNAFFDQAKGLLAACGLQVAEEDDAPAAISSPPGRVIREAGASAPQFWTLAAVAFIAFVVGTFAGGLAVYARFVGF